MENEYADIKAIVSVWRVDMINKESVMDTTEDEATKNKLSIQIDTIKECIADLETIIYS